MMSLEKIIIKIDDLKEELDSLRPLREDHLSRLNQKDHTCKNQIKYHRLSSKKLLK